MTAPAVTITTADGPLTGTLSGRDPDRREVQVAVRRETAPAWFQERYKSRVVRIETLIDEYAVCR